MSVRLNKLRLVLSLLLIISFSVVSQAELPDSVSEIEMPAPAPKKTTRDDLVYRTALYEYYQFEYLTALSRLASVKESTDLSVEAHEPELLRANILLSLSLHEEAKKVFTEQLGKHAQNSNRDQLWFNLSKLFYQREEFDQVIGLLASINTKKLPEDLSLEFNYMVASALQHYGDLSAAEQYLKKLDHKTILSGYAHLNQAIAYMGINSGRRVIEEMLTKSRAALNNSKEGLALKDKINLIAGRFYLEAGKSNNAAKTLKKVRLTGPYSDQALLSLGWALVDHWKYQEAMQPWYRLTKNYRLINPNRQEAALAIAYILERLKAKTQALSGYKRAARQYEDELEQLEDVRGHLKTGLFLDGLVKQQPLQELGWKVATKNELDSTSIVIDYLEQFLADKAFQHEFTQLRDLNSLNNILQRALMDTQGYLEVIALRETQSNQIKKANVLHKKQQGLVALNNRYQDMKALYFKAKKEEDGKELANDKEWQQAFSVERIQALLVDIAKDTSKTRDLQAYRDRLKRVSGLLTWQLEESHSERLWALKQQLIYLKDNINLGEKSLSIVKIALDQQPEHYGPITARLKFHEKNIIKKMMQINSLMVEQKQIIVDLANESLNLHQERISNYLVQSRLAIARLYDDAFSHHEREGDDEDGDYDEEAEAEDERDKKNDVAQRGGL
jgi:hypothetical protein